MVVIRLNRVGAKNKPKYRITVADSRRYVKGKFIEVIGTYNPHPSEAEKSVVLDMEKYNEWTKKGALATDRVKSVVKLAQAQK